MKLTPGLTEQEIADRADTARPSRIYLMLLSGAVLLLAGLSGFSPALQLWIRAHHVFILGMLCGSLAEFLVILASRWLWDRWLWLRWFSHQ